MISEREGLSYCSVGGLVYAFGGKVQNNFYNDMFVLCLDANSK